VSDRNTLCFGVNKDNGYAVILKDDIGKIEIEWAEELLVSPLLQVRIAIFGTFSKEKSDIWQNGGNKVYFDANQCTRLRRSSTSYFYRLNAIKKKAQVREVCITLPIPTIMESIRTVSITLL
jgi:hypothetical protein